MELGCKDMKVGGICEIAWGAEWSPEWSLVVSAMVLSVFAMIGIFFVTLLILGWLDNEVETERDD
jgi:hypothetical protein